MNQKSLELWFPLVTQTVHTRYGYHLVTNPSIASVVNSISLIVLPEVAEIILDKFGSELLSTFI